MAIKTVTLLQQDCIRCGGSTGPEVVPSDTVKMYLDQVAIPAFPEWVAGTVIDVSPTLPLISGGRSYIIQYESDDLLGAAQEIRECDIISVVCEGCCKIISDYLNALATANPPFVELSSQWNPDGSIGITARAYSTNITGAPPVPSEIVSYIFLDPNNAVMPEDGIDNYREWTPADVGGVDWPGGVFAVQATDSTGLSSQAYLWVAPKPRYVKRYVTVPAGQIQVDAGLAVGEEIVSITAMSAAGGFYAFSADQVTPSLIHVSGAVAGPLNLIILVHIP